MIAIAACLRCPAVFSARSASPRCPKCKAWGENVRVLDWNELAAIVRSHIPVSVRVTAPEELVHSPPLPREDSSSSPPLEGNESRGRGTQTSPGARDTRDGSLPPFLDERVNLDSVERSWWRERIDTYSLREQRDWLREKLEHGFLLRVTHADLDSIRERFLARGPPKGVISGL